MGIDLAGANTNAAALVIVAVIVAISSTVGPLLVQRSTNVQRRKERAEDKADRDAVAHQAQEAADKLVQSNADVAAAAKETGAKTLAAVGVIHTLVNSNLTDAIEASLVASEANLTSLRELADLRLGLGQKPTTEALAMFRSVEGQVSELRLKLQDRKRQGVLAQIQILAEEQREKRA